MSQMNVFNPIMHEMVKNLAPWHSFIAGPGFPVKPLYRRDEQFRDIEQVVVKYYASDLQSITAVSKTGETASVLFEIIDDLNLKKMLCHLKKNETTELTITEWFDNNKVYLTIRRPESKEYDVDIVVTAIDGNIHEFDIFIKFNSQEFRGIIKAKSLDVPQIALDFAEAISSMQSSHTIAAADPKIIGIITMEAYKMFYQEIRDIVWHAINFVASVLVHILTVCWGGALAHIISFLLIPSELHTEEE
ncbi:MAG: hypothetical protein K0B81_02290 [Candidatus Cloacimonetes bacterium]|nr:hypothetical protein [Candidatus Cloacimonadota bacterium]